MRNEFIKSLCLVFILEEVSGTFTTILNVPSSTEIKSMVVKCVAGPGGSRTVWVTLCWVLTSMRSGRLEAWLWRKGRGRMAQFLVHVPRRSWQCFTVHVCGRHNFLLMCPLLASGKGQRLSVHRGYQAIQGASIWGRLYQIRFFGHLDHEA